MAPASAGALLYARHRALSGLARSLKSAADENPLPCARSLLAQGFDPADVSTWSATGGIPEDAAPFILEHYSNAKSHAGDSDRCCSAAIAGAIGGIAWKDRGTAGVMGHTHGGSPYLHSMPRLEGREWLLELAPEKFAGNSANYFSCP